MKVRLATSSGFCFGVKRAMDLAVKASQKNQEGPVFTDGPLIHNPQAIEVLRTKGITPLHKIKGGMRGTVIIRSHGISPESLQELKTSGMKVIDATCPKVNQVQAIIDKHAKQGFYIVIIGEQTHAEVKGLLGFGGGKSTVIQCQGDLKKIPQGYKICVVAQTTQNRKKFLVLKEKIKERFPEAEIFDTICEANRKRQEELKELCHVVDAVIVVGGKESGNTKRLVEIAKEEGSPTFFAENEEALDLSQVRSYNEIGLIGGASTPDWVLQKMVTKLTRSND